MPTMTIITTVMAVIIPVITDIMEIIIPAITARTDITAILHPGIIIIIITITEITAIAQLGIVILEMIGEQNQTGFRKAEIRVQELQPRPATVLQEARPLQEVIHHSDLRHSRAVTPHQAEVQRLQEATARHRVVRTREVILPLQEAAAEEINL